MKKKEWVIKNKVLETNNCMITFKIIVMKNKYLKLSFILMVSIILGLIACQENTEDTPTGKGQLVVKLTDAPLPIDLIDQALITIDKVEIHLAADSLEENEAGSFIVLSEETQQFNLLDLRNGITAHLLAVNLNPGKYDMVRVHIVESEIILKDGKSFNLKVPSGSTSGLKIKLAPSLEIVSGLTSELLLDFDVNKSFVIQGNIKRPDNIKGFIFKPVVRAVCQQISVNIAGTVVDTTGVPVAEAYIQVIQADTVYTSTLTNDAGKYAMIGIPAGTYKVVCGKEGFTTEEVEAEIILQQTTIQDFEITPVLQDSIQDN